MSVSTSGHRPRGLGASRPSLPPALIPPLAVGEGHHWRPCTGYFTIPVDILVHHAPFGEEAVVVTFGQAFELLTAAHSFSTVLDEIHFRVSDATGMHRAITNLDAATSHEGHLPAVSAISTSIAEIDPISDDVGQAVSSAWLTKAYSALFRPIETEDAALPDDPDDFPVF